MKKILTICACLVAGAAMAQTRDAEGFITISSADELAKIGTTGYALNDKYRLTENINLSSISWTWTPIGTTDEDHSFQGTFDGNGKTISNLKISIINETQETYVGFFGRIGSYGMVKDIKLSSGEVNLLKGSGDISGNVGSIVGVNHGQVINCTSSAEVYCADDGTDVGGIVGENRGVIQNCTYTGKIDVGDVAGENLLTYAGIVGDNETGGSVSECKVINATFVPHHPENVSNCSDRTKIYGQNNGNILDNYDVEGTTVKFVGRTLYKDGEWNTICLPFDVTIVGSIFEGAIVKELDVTTKETSTPDVYKTRVYQKDGDVFYTLNLEFVGVLTIKAGKPYLIKWTDGEHLENPVFTNVDMNSYSENPIGVTSADGCVTFQGLLSAKDIATGGDNSILFLSGGNMLYYPEHAMTIGANRAYFQLNNNFTFADSQVPSTASIRAFSLSYGEEFGSATDIDSVKEYSSTLDASWYTLQGIPLDGKPAEKGIYIYNGKKVMIK